MFVLFSACIHDYCLPRSGELVELSKTNTTPHYLADTCAGKMYVDMEETLAARSAVAQASCTE